MNATALPSREDEGRPSTNRRGDIACQLTSSGEPILVLTASDLMKLQAKRKQARARASDGMEYSTVDPLPARPPPATTPNSTFDALNFVHYVPEPDLACLDLKRYFLEACQLVHFSPFCDPHSQPTADELWARRCTLRPRPPVDESVGVCGSFDEASTTDSGACSDASCEASTTDEPSAAWTAATPWGRGVLLRRLLPLSDRRRLFSAQYIRLFNNCRLARLFRRSLTPEVHWSNHFLGRGENPYGPNEVNLHGVDSVRTYYESIVRIAPDVVHHLVRSEIFVSAQAHVLVATTRLIYGTRVFRGVTEALADITLTAAPRAAPGAAHRPDPARRLLGVEHCGDGGSDDDRDADADADEPLRVVARLRSTDPDDADAPTARRKLPQARVALENVELGDGRAICALDVTFAFFAPSSPQAHRVVLFHSGVS